MPTLIVSLGPALEPGDEVLDLACGDGGLGEALLARGLRYRGVDSTPEMVGAARARLGEASFQSTRATSTTTSRRAR